MARKKWVAKTDITETVIRLREKKRWQISLRRYVLERNPCIQYAPYFGLDIDHIRNWFEIQFEEGMGWTDFGKKWQFEHILPVAYFDFANDDELKLCWNFTNIRIEMLTAAIPKPQTVDILAAKRFFTALYQETQYPPCLRLIKKIETLENLPTQNLDKKQVFLLQNRSLLDRIEKYTAFEYELLNSGRTIDEITTEVNFLKKF